MKKVILSIGLIFIGFILGVLLYQIPSIRYDHNYNGRIDVSDIVDFFNTYNKHNK